MRTNPHRLKASEGFTLIELLIASAVFSVILLLCAFALLQIGKIYYKGVAQSRTQEVARSIMDDVSQSIQFGGGSVAQTSPEPAFGTNGPSATQNFCVGTKNYNFVLWHQLSDNPSSTQQSKHVIVLDPNAPACPTGKNISDVTASGLSLTGSQRELMSPGMQLTDLKVQLVDPFKQLWQIRIKVVSGDADLFDWSDQHNPVCKSGLLGTQFCAVSGLTTVVQKRL